MSNPRAASEPEIANTDTQQHSPNQDEPAGTETLAQPYSQEHTETSAIPWTNGGAETVPSQQALDQSPAVVSTSHGSPIVAQGNPFTPPDVSVTSATFPSPDPTVNAAAFRWFGLLASDAARESSQLYASLAGFENECVSLDRGENDGLAQPTSLQCATQVLDLHTSSGQFDGGADIAPGDTTGSPSEERLWQAQEPIELLPRETFLFANFIKCISQWVFQLTYLVENHRL